MKKVGLVIFIFFVFPSILMASGGHTGLGTLSMFISGVGTWANVQMGTALQAQCDKGDNPMACALATQSYAQAAQDAVSLLEAFQSKNAADSGVSTSSPFEPPPMNNLDDLDKFIDDHQNDINRAWNQLPEDMTLEFQKPDISKKIKDMKRKGFDVDLNTGKVTLPDGSTISAEEMSSAKRSGKVLSTDGIKKINQVKRKVSRLLNKSSKLAKGGGLSSGMGSSSYKPPSLDLDHYNYNFKPSKLGLGLNQRTPASVQGLKKAVGAGESIGVAGDNIFHMITRRYTEMNKQDMFAKE